MIKINKIEEFQLREDIIDFKPGDAVKVYVKVKESGRERTQAFQGIVIARQGSGIKETFTVRKISFGVGVERTFPVHSTNIQKIELINHGDVRRAKLYYLREKIGKKAKVKVRIDKNIDKVNKEK